MFSHRGENKYRKIQRERDERKKEQQRKANGISVYVCVRF